MAVGEAVFRTMKDPDLPYAQKALIVGSIAYLLLPIDAIPDFLPGGFADDLSLMLGALYSTGKIGKKHLQECRLKHGLVAKVEGYENESNKEQATPPQE